MKIFDILTVGGAVRDVTFYTNAGRFFRTPENLTAQKMLAFEYGAKINIAEANCSAGGGAANAAVSFQKLGFKAAILARVGRDFSGQQLRSELKKLGIAADFIQSDEVLPTGFSFILAANKKEPEHIAFLYRGANENLEVNFQILNQLPARYYYLTSLSGRNWLKNLKEIFGAARKKNVKIAWNPGNLQLQAGRKALDNFLKQTEVLILNKDEAIELVLSGIKIGRRNPRFLNKSVYLLNILNEWGPKIAVITDGERGAAAFESGKVYKIKSLKKKVTDTTGVGDAFGAAFTAGLIYSRGEVKQGLVWGILNSASVLTQTGAQNGILSRKELLEQAGRVKI